MPSAFTPNNDGRNDVFRIKYPEIITTMQLVVFNRWGQQVFTGARPDEGWDAAGVPDGVYAWKLRIRDTLGKRHEHFGHVSVLR